MSCALGQPDEGLRYIFGVGVPENLHDGFAGALGKSVELVARLLGSILRHVHP